MGSNPTPLRQPNKPLCTHLAQNLLRAYSLKLPLDIVPRLDITYLTTTYFRNPTRHQNFPTPALAPAARKSKKLEAHLRKNGSLNVHGLPPGSRLQLVVVVHNEPLISQQHSASLYQC
jgi:hypothetical protein